MHGTYFSRTFWIFLALAVILTAVVIGLHYSSKRNIEVDKSISPRASLAAALALTTGDIYVKGAQNESFIQAKEGDTLHAGDSVKTPKDGRAIIVLDTGDVIRLNTDTEVLLKTISVRGVTVQNIQGDVYSRVTYQPTKQYRMLIDQYELTTLGTAFNTTYDALNNILTFQVTEGKINVHRENDVQEVTTNQGASVNLDQLGEAVKITTLADKELESDWLLWNKTHDQREDESAPIK